MTIKRRVRREVQDEVSGVPTRIDERDAVIPRRLTSVAVPTSSMSEALWVRMRERPTNPGPRISVFSPPVTTASLPKPKEVARKGEVTLWVLQPWTKRSWDKWLAIVARPKDLTSAVEALWGKKHALPVPDTVVVVVDKHSVKGEVKARSLAVFPHTENAVAILHRRYPGRAILSITRQLDGHSVIVSPIAGPASAEILKTLFKRRDVQVKHAVEQNVAIRVAGTKKIVTGDQTELLWDVFLAYVRKNAKSLVALCSHIQATLDLNAELLPNEFALTALRHGDNVHSIIPMSWEEADKLLDGYLVVYFKQLFATRYVPVRIRGSYAMDVVEEIFKGNGTFKAKIPPIERLLVAGTLTTGHVKDVKAQAWEKYLSYVKTLGHGFWNRMAVIYQATHYHKLGEDDALPHLWLLIDRDQIEGADYLQRFVVSDCEGRASAGAIQIAPTATGTRIVSLRGTGVFEVALAWVEGIGFKVQNVIEKGFLGGTWGYEIQWRHSKESPTWEGWRQYVQRQGLQGLGQRMRQIYEVVHAGETAPDDIVVVGRRIKKDGDAIFRNLQVLTVEDAAPYVAGLNTMTLQLRRLPNGQETLVSASGIGGKEIASLLNPQGGQVFAPDAKSDGVAEKYSLRPEIFVGDELTSKPEPLFTPADVVKVEPMIRPAVVVALPREGGFQITDPEAVKKFATPPSNKIPVITPTGAAAVIVVAAILVLMDGPLPIMDAVAASFVGARLVF